MFPALTGFYVDAETGVKVRPPVDPSLPPVTMEMIDMALYLDEPWLPRRAGLAQPLRDALCEKLRALGWVRPPRSSYRGYMYEPAL